MIWRKRLTCEDNLNVRYEYLIQQRKLLIGVLFSPLSNRLIGLEQDLRRIATDQGKNVNELVDLVNENELVLDQMKLNLRQTFVAAMARVSKFMKQA